MRARAHAHLFGIHVRTCTRARTRTHSYLRYEKVAWVQVGVDEIVEEDLVWVDVCEEKQELVSDAT